MDVVYLQPEVQAVSLEARADLDRPLHMHGWQR